MVQSYQLFSKKLKTPNVLYYLHIQSFFEASNCHQRLVMSLSERLQIPRLSEDRILFFWGIRIKQKQITSYIHNVKIVFVKLLSHVRLFCDPMDCSQLGSSFHGISLQTRILEWVAIAFSRAPTWCSYLTQVSFTGRQILYQRTQC